MKIELFFGGNSPFFKDALWIRNNVFTEEQGYAAEIDYDDRDRIAWQLVLYNKKEPIGTGRLYKEDGKFCFRIGRIALLESYRGEGLGYQIMNALIGQAKKIKNQEKIIMIHAQLYVEKFYQRLNFVTEGESFIEDGEPHILMVYRL